MLSTPKSEQNYHDRSDMMWFITKIRQDNDMTDHTGAVYDENEV